MNAAVLRRRLLRSLLSLQRQCPSCHSSSRTVAYASAIPFTGSRQDSLGRGLLSSPWSVVQQRGAKVLGTDVRRGNIIQRKGRIFQVLEAQHTQHGRGGATIQVELRDVDSGNKISERFRTDEAIERVIVEDKSFSFLYQEGNSIFIMDPSTFEQIELPKEMLGKAAVYLKDDMPISLQLYDGKPMSASIPRRVTCTVAEAQPYSKGQTAQPQYKRVLLDNGVTVHIQNYIGKTLVTLKFTCLESRLCHKLHSELIKAPSYIKIGEKVVVDTTEDKYVTRYKE